MSWYTGDTVWFPTGSTPDAADSTPGATGSTGRGHKIRRVRGHACGLLHIL